jgi:predicted nucleic acid-binding protein
MMVFGDTSGFFAFLSATDSSHERMKQTFGRLLRERAVIRTTSYVLIETMALLQHRIGLDAIRDFEEEMMPLLEVEWVSVDLHRRGMRRLLQADRRQLSLVDCVSLEYMRQHQLRDVLGLDRHFTEAGYRLLTS